MVARRAEPSVHPERNTSQTSRSRGRGCLYRNRDVCVCSGQLDHAHIGQAPSARLRRHRRFPVTPSSSFFWLILAGAALTCSTAEEDNSGANGAGMAGQNLAAKVYHII